MKMFYTKAQLAKLTNEEMLELTTFGNEDTTLYYSQLNYIHGGDGSWILTFKDGSNVTTDSEELINSVKLGKARFDLISKSIEDDNEIKTLQKEFIQWTKESLVSEIETMRSISKTQNLDAIRLVNDVNDKLDKITSHWDERLDIVTKKWDDQIDTLKVFDTKAYTAKMSAIDKIISAFSKLLKD